jgi:hypothetical protein
MLILTHELTKFMELEKKLNKMVATILLFFTFGLQGNPKVPVFLLIENHKPTSGSLSLGGFWTPQG